MNTAYSLKLPSSSENIHAVERIFVPQKGMEGTVAKYIVTYDLRKPDYDYQPLYDSLAMLDAVHIQDSVWALRSDQNAEYIFDYLWSDMHSAKDRLLVVEMKESNWKNENGIQKLKPV